MKITQSIIFFIIVIVLVLGAVVTFIVRSSSENGIPSGKYDDFATCLKDQGAVFYGTFWCSHCKAQKEMFGSSVKLLPYVECSTPDGQKQTQICEDKKIEGYPTWEFADGSRLTGRISFEKLAEKTGCELPVEPVE